MMSATYIRAIHACLPPSTRFNGMPYASRGDPEPLLRTPWKVIGINGEWPLPLIEVDKGDQLVVNMYNGLGDKSASIHFHGMFQNGTNEMDGASMINQCPIIPGSSFLYDFSVPEQYGTYW